MLDPRVSRLTEILLQHSLRVQPGDRVLVETFDVPPEVTAHVVEALGAAGALPLVETRQTPVLRSLYRAATPEQMRLLGELELERMRRVECYLALRGAANSAEFSDVPPERLDLYQRYWWRPVHTEQRCTHTRWVVLRWPTPAMAQAANQSTAAFEEFYFSVCCFDYARMARAVEPLAARLAAAGEIRVTGPGTNLTMRKEGLPAVPCVGERNIPDGECFTAPHREGVEGEICFNTASRYQGRTFEGIRLVLRKGRIVEATASDTPALQAILDSDEGARYVGEFSLGFHPGILHPMLDTLFDEKIAGSLHFTPGSAYAVADNGNRSQVHWDLVLIQRPEYGGGCIYLDGEPIRRDGLFVPEDLRPLNPEFLGAAPA